MTVRIGIAGVGRMGRRHAENLATRTPVRTSIDDGVAALVLADAATTSWREKRVVELG